MSSAESQCQTERNLQAASGTSPTISRETPLTWFRPGLLVTTLSQAERDTPIPDTAMIEADILSKGHAAGRSGRVLLSYCPQAPALARLLNPLDPPGAVGGRNATGGRCYTEIEVPDVRIPPTMSG